MLDEGSSRDQSANALTSSTSTSSLSDSDTDALMVSQELRTRFSSDKDVGTGRSRRNHDSPDTHSEPDHKPVESRDQIDAHFDQWVTIPIFLLDVIIN